VIRRGPSRDLLWLHRLLATSCFLLFALGCSPQAEYFGNINPPEGSVFRFNVGPEPEFLDPAPPPPAYHPQDAARLLAEAGFPNGEGFPTLEVLVPPDRRAVAEAAQQMWARNLNIRVTIHSEEFSSFLKRWDQMNYDVAGSRWIGDYLDPSTFTDLMESTNGNNNTGYNNPEYDRLQAEARFELDPAKRLELLQRAEALMLADAPVIPIYIMAANELVKPYVRGVYPAMWDVLPLSQVWIDHQWQESAAERTENRTALGGGLR